MERRMGAELGGKWSRELWGRTQQWAKGNLVKTICIKAMGTKGKNLEFGFEFLNSNLRLAMH